jgi:hypothetical protein
MVANVPFKNAKPGKPTSFEVHPSALVPGVVPSVPLIQADATGGGPIGQLARCPRQIEGLDFSQVTAQCFCLALLA